MEEINSDERERKGTCKATEKMDKKPKRNERSILKLLHEKRKSEKRKGESTNDDSTSKVDERRGRGGERLEERMVSPKSRNLFQFLAVVGQMFRHRHETKVRSEPTDVRFTIVPRVPTTCDRWSPRLR